MSRAIAGCLYMSFDDVEEALADRPHVEAFDGLDVAWSGFRVLDGLDATLSLPLSEIDRRVLPAG